MGSIPLLASTIRPIEQPDLLGNFQRLQALKSAQQEQQYQAQEQPYRQQIMQEQAAQAPIQTQQMQQAQRDQQAMTAAMHEWDGKSLDDLPSLVLKNGGSSTAVMGLKQKALEQKQTYSKIAADDATTGTKQIDTLKQKNDIVSGAMQAVMQLPDEQLPQALLSKAQELAQQGLLDPPHLQIAQRLAQSGNPQAIRQSLDVMQKGLLSNTELLAQAKEAEDKRHNTAIEAQTAATAANTNAYRQAEVSLGKGRLSAEQARLAFEQKKAGMGADGQPNPLSQAIASGHITPDRMGYLLSRNPELINGVMQIDPSFDSSKAQSYPATYKDFTSGKTSIAINSGGTALSHLKELSEMNTVASHIPGTPDYNAYQNKADTVASELAKFYGDATIPAIASIKKTLTSTLPGNRQAAIETQAQSMGDKLDSFQQQWENAAPSKVYQAPMPGISQKAVAARAALDPKFKAAQGTSQAPAGGGIGVGSVITQGGHKFKVTAVDANGKPTSADPLP